MRRWWWWMAVVVVLSGRPASAAVFAVPDAVRHMRVPHEESHVLRASASGTRLGEQRLRAVVENDTLVIDVATRFASGEEWDERAEMSLAHGYRATAFRKVARRAGKTVAEERVDFTTGLATWARAGVRGTRTFTFAPDTYLGPMLGVVLAVVAEEPSVAASFQTVVFRPEPEIYTLRAVALGEENFPLGDVVAPTTKVRLKADLGPVQNLLLARAIPTHYFWFTRETSPEFFAFEGELGYGGPVLRMVPVRAAAATARADAAALTP